MLEWSGAGELANDKVSLARRIGFARGHLGATTDRFRVYEVVGWPLSRGWQP